MTRAMWQSNPSTKTKISQDCPGVTREDHRKLSSSLWRNGMNTAVRINWLSNTVFILFNYSRPARFWFCLDRPILRPGHCNCLFLIIIKVVSMYKYVDLHHLDFEVVQTVFLFTFVWINILMIKDILVWKSEDDQRNIDANSLENQLTNICSWIKLDFTTVTN